MADNTTFPSLRTLYFLFFNTLSEISTCSMEECFKIVGLKKIICLVFHVKTPSPDFFAGINRSNILI